MKHIPLRQLTDMDAHRDNQIRILLMIYDNLYHNDGFDMQPMFDSAAYSGRTHRCLVQSYGTRISIDPLNEHLRKGFDQIGQFDEDLVLPYSLRSKYDKTHRSYAFSINGVPCPATSIRALIMMRSINLYINGEIDVHTLTYYVTQISFKH